MLIDALISWFSLAISTFVSEDLACIAGGVLISQGKMSFIAVVSACGLGIFLGDMLIFMSGKWIGHKALHKRPLKWWITPDTVAAKKQWLSKNGFAVILLTRFMPGTRVATYFAAGLLDANFFRILLYFLGAVALWTPLLVWAAFIWGQQLQHWYGSYKSDSTIFLCGAVIAALILFKGILPLFRFKSRRLMLSRLYRLMRWEFWSPWFFYPPIVAFIVALALRYRCSTLFMIVNPGIAYSGFIGESKLDILKKLSEKSFDAVAPFEKLPKNLTLFEMKKIIMTFVKQHGKTFPVVLKPDLGLRGMNVHIVHSETELDALLPQITEEYIIQKYISGEEWGIFYYRYPNESHGHIYSITAKKMTSVVGDGMASLERLILTNKWAHFRAKIFLKTHADRLSWIPKKDEIVPLVQIGSHCRGSLFLDANDCLTPQLEAAIEKISQGYDGFYFGRFDVRSASQDDLKLGRFKILELNGVTSEATHIYDPKYSLFTAYKVLMQQWFIAHRIGKQNRCSGFIPMTLKNWIKLIWDNR